MSTESEKVVIVELLEFWKECRCLWDLEDKNYPNRDRRNECYNSLLEIYKKCMPEASISTIKKKLENMRTAYKREARKVMASETTGSGSDQVYIPKLWYFDLLTFLDETATVTGGTETLEDESSKDTEENVTVEPSEMEGSTPTSTHMTPSQQRKRLRTSLEKKKESLVNTAHALLASKDDKWEVIGKSLGLQLKELSTDQQDIAQKLMAELIFYGKRGRLTDNTYINLNPHHFNNLPQHFPSPSPSRCQYPYSTPSPASSMMTTTHVTAATQQPSNVSNPTVDNQPFGYYT